MDRHWRPLPVAPHANVPPLLVATSFDSASSSYSVAVTDLARIWSESLDRRGICMRAFRENTTIDPSYDSEQMGVFLGKIQSAFDARGDPDCSLALASSGDDLVVHVSCALPGGLPPLEWPLHLTLSSNPSSSVSSSLVRPLMKDRAQSQRSTAALIAALRQKDAVIAKLVDKLDAVGAGAESAFPSLLPSGGGSSSRRAGGSRMLRADMERRIKGLAPFDEADFSQQLKVQGDSLDHDSSIASLVSTFGELPCGQDDFLAEDKPWWQSLGGRKVALTRIASATDSQDTLQSEGHSKPSSKRDEEDGFQTTPSRAAKTTDPVSDPPSPTPDTLHTPSKASRPKGLGKIGRLGGIGKKKVEKKEEKEEEDNTPAKPPPPAVDVDEDETASEAEAEAEAEAENEMEEKGEERRREETKAEVGRLETVTAVRPKSARGGLGRIGGKKEKEPTESKESKESEKAFEKTSKKETQKEPETGEKDAAKRKADGKESPAASQTPLLPSQAITETKRAEILQQAVAKNAAPVRKKRKF
ncbi:c6 zinc finger domain containing protein [Ophiostoma piceae UAMH 11346]|uniref:Non-homologous end-joining factor 1 n=1 Tax=Ophiostoma piceae (strain UAMH 11346) TaxID=1262450 RepID=S3C8H9_OPHP1|nr:c6 zinc finger domain containing protein [Ophiostoma piceae UAMH 11346]